MKFDEIIICQHCRFVKKKSVSLETLFEYCRLRYRKHCFKTFVRMISPRNIYSVYGYFLTTLQGGCFQHSLINIIREFQRSYCGFQNLSICCVVIIVYIIGICIDLKIRFVASECITGITAEFFV